MKTKTLGLVAAVGLSAWLLAACGGGGGDDEPAAAEDPTAVPAGAASSVTAWFNFAKALASTDTAQPLSLGQLGELPITETAEPLPLGP